MATETDQTYCDWSHSDFSVERSSSQETSSSVVQDHGSISFGRYAAESLEWGKWSIFPQNSCQEELEKFKAPGLVAQKKAYFEEHYKKIRALKALHAEQEANHGPDLVLDNGFSGQTEEDGQISKPQENSVAVATTEEVRNQSDAPQAQILERETMASYPVSCGGGFKEGRVEDNENIELQSNDCKDYDCNTILHSDLDMSVHTSGPEASAEENGADSTGSTSRQLEVSESKDIVSNKVEINVYNGEDHTLAPKAKEVAASVVTKGKQDHKPKEAAVKPPQRPKSRLPKEITRKVENGVVSSKATASKITNSRTTPTSVSSQRPLTELRSNVTISHPSSTGMDKRPPTSSSTRSVATSGNLIFKSSVKKLPSKSSDHVQRPSSVQCASKNAACIGGVRKASENRPQKDVVGKSSALSNRKVVPKGRDTEDQKPKAISTNTSLSKSSQSNRIELGAKSNVSGGKHKLEILEKSMRASSKLASSMLSSAQHAQTRKQEHKNDAVSSRSVNLTLVGRKPRQGLPAWR